MVRWVGIQALSELTGLSNSEVSDKFKYSDVANQFERGLCSNPAFIQEFRELFDLKGSDKDLTQLWNSWVQAPYEGIVDAILSLKNKYQICCLSNTNDLHWRHLQSYLNLDLLFSPAYASHQIHLAKPDRACFDYIIGDLGIPAQSILFFDDTMANVEAANSAGLQAHLVNPQFGALPRLKSLGLLD